MNVGSAGTVPWGLDYLRLKWSQRGGEGVVLGAWESHVHGLVTIQAIGKAPLRLAVHGGFGGGDGETRRSECGKVRPVPTLRSGGETGDRPADHDLAGAAPSQILNKIGANPHSQRLRCEVTAG